jgi:hypothetical protein
MNWHADDTDLANFHELSIKTISVNPAIRVIRVPLFKKMVRG